MDKYEAPNSFRKKTILLTIDLCNMSTTLHSDSDVNSSKTLLAQQQHWLQKLKNIDVNHTFNKRDHHGDQDICRCTGFSQYTESTDCLQNTAVSWSKLLNPN